MGSFRFSYAAVTTNVAYGDNPGDTVRMGKITAGGSVTFTNTNTLTQGATGTAKNFSLPLITYSSRTGDFSTYVLSWDVENGSSGGNLALWRTV